MIFEAFRRRQDEAAEIASTESLRSLLSFAEPVDEPSRIVRKAQIDALIRLVPATIVCHFAVAAVICTGFYTEVPGWQLALWLGFSFILCGSRAVRAFRLRHNLDYARRRPTSMRAICVIVAMLAATWAVPLWWNDLMGPHDRLLLGVVYVALTCAGTVTLGTVAPAAITYVVLLTACEVLAGFCLGSMPYVVLSTLFGAIMIWSVLNGARRFNANVRSHLELQEQSELIALLREFEASGSDWLWELDEKLHVTYMSTAMAEAIGIPHAELIGRPASLVLDPDGEVAKLSTGMRAMFAHVSDRTPFKDLAVPALKGRRWWSLSGKPLIDSRGRFLGWRGVGSDITDLRLSGSDAVRAARRDPMTGIANRLLVREQLEEALLRRLAGEAGCTLMLVDLDRFKLVNDTLGHAVGDQLLCEVARRLERVAGSGSCVGRLGGDEFAIIWTGPQDHPALSGLAERIIAEISRTFQIGAASLHVGCTVGIAIGGGDGISEETLMRSADLALYSAKEEGRGGYAFYANFMLERAEGDRLLENDVRDALNSDALSLAYQPIVDARSGAIVGREALLRWNHPQRGAIPPDLFIPVIEDAGLIHQIGDWVLREACTEAATWSDEARVAVNISAAQLGGAGLAKTVFGALASSGLAPGRLELEVTESIFMGDDLSTLGSLEALRSLGVGLVLDDFGKGYSSFGYLSRARFSKIKIDQSFVRAAAAGEREGRAILDGILALARGLGMATTAEGIETEAEAEVMRELGCHQLQGYYFGRPRPAEAVAKEERRAVRRRA
ncbi:phosphodiesterase [Sphingomonas ginkgonis]|uniref:Phosphodiesterase n=1 Tax=Sphingomonas ginkgonis TaxID=2315330 RepID=A0A429V9R9_9SPHN|nr:GGDEF domain-containing phosphodiesterase [Sphingomonas ginkgonis]RST30612.1 phosphodiesterase [Sphingomonas ginkgonis]